MRFPLATAALLLIAAPLAAAKAKEPSPTPTPVATPTYVVIAQSSGSYAWMEKGKLLVSGSALGLRSEKDARQIAIQDAAAKAAEFLEKQGLGKSSEVRRGLEDSILRETPLVAANYGDVKIEDSCQERWSNENGVDHWSMHLTLSIRVGQKDQGKK